MDKNIVPQPIREMHRAIKTKTHDYYWWKHRKTNKEQEEINKLQVISIKDLSVILADFIRWEIDDHFDKQAFIKALTSNWMPPGYMNTDDGN